MKLIIYFILKLLYVVYFLFYDHYQLKQILKGYQNSKDELKGYNSKYINQLTDLLYKKDKNFTKKRSRCYHKRRFGKSIKKQS